MPRIEIELTSSRPDGTWTWRAAGARQPKGSLDGALLHSGARVGDVLRAECEMDLDGTRVTAVLPPRTTRAEDDRLPLLGSSRETPLVTQDGGAPDLRGERPRREGRRDGRSGGRFGERREGGARPAGRDAGARTPGGPPAGRPSSERTPRSGAEHGERGPRQPGDRPRSPVPGDREGAGRGRSRAAESGRPESRRPESRRPESRRPESGRPAAPTPEARPRTKRLQPGRAHRDAVLAELSPEQRAVAEQVLRGGLPAVRQAVEEQNARARSEGAPQVKADALMTMAESLLPGLRAAEWRDRAEAAAASVDEIGLRDLRAVVAGSDAAGRDEESRALAVRLREALERRGAAERATWMDEIRRSLADGRVVRALRVSGRPPEPGVRFPADLAEALGAAAGEAMTADTAPDRWAALLDAVLASPVRRNVQPQGVPSEREPEFERALRLAAPRVPALATLLGGALPPPPGGPGPGPAGRRRPSPGGPSRRRPGSPPRPTPPPPARSAAPEAVAPPAAGPDVDKAADPAPAAEPAPVADAAPAAEPAPAAGAVPASPSPAEAPAAADVPAAAEAPAVVEPPPAAPAPLAPEPAPAAEAPPAAETPAATDAQTAGGGEPPLSGDDGDDPVLVQELS